MESSRGINVHVCSIWSEYSRSGARLPRHSKLSTKVHVRPGGRDAGRNTRLSREFRTLRVFGRIGKVHFRRALCPGVCSVLLYIGLKQDHHRCGIQTYDRVGNAMAKNEVEIPKELFDEWLESILWKYLNRFSKEKPIPSLLPQSLSGGHK